MKPELYSLCYLPLHAAILVYLYDTLNNDLPTTHSSLFESLGMQLCCTTYSRAHQLSTSDVTDFPANLPDDIHSSFNKVTKLACMSILERKTEVDRGVLACVMHLVFFELN